MAYLDTGEMFLNFVLHASIKLLCRIDLWHFFQSEVREGGMLWERFGALPHGHQDITISEHTSHALDVQDNPGLQIGC